MNSCCRLSVISAALAWAVLGTPMFAQRAEVARGDDLQPTRDAAVFARLVTMKVGNMSLRHAIRELAANAAVRIHYQIELIDAVKRPVSLDVTNVPLGVALDYVLKGTGLYAVPTASDLVTLKQVIGPGHVAQGVVVGKVIHAKTRQPVPGAIISWEGKQGSVVSGGDGIFRLPAGTGELMVQVRAVGFVKQARRVVVGDGVAAIVEFVLEPSASVLDDVVVTGTVVATARKEIATPITIITADEIERRGITRIDQLMRGDIPGLLAIETGSLMYTDTLGAMASVNMMSRGASSITGKATPNPIKTYVDGVELENPAYLGTIDPQSIERIEVITGPQAATIYGTGALGGVMQIFTKKGLGRSTSELGVQLGYGMLESNLSSGMTPAHNHQIRVAGGAGPVLSYTGNVSYNYTGQWQPALYSRRTGISLGATHQKGQANVNGSINLSHGANGTIRSSSQPWIRVGARDRIVNGDWSLRNSAEAFALRTSTSSGLLLALSMDYRATAFWQHSVTVGRSQNAFELVPEAPVFSMWTDTLYRASSSTGQRISIGYNTTISPVRIGVLSSSLTVGGNGSAGTTTRIAGCLISKNASSYGGCDLSASKSPQSQSTGGFATWRLGAFDRLYLTLGLRGEHNSAYGDARNIDWTPTNGLAYTLEYRDVSVKFLGSYGSATRAPGAEDREGVRSFMFGLDPSWVWFRLPNPNLRPERERGPQGGVEIYYGNVGMLTVNYFRQRTVDLLWIVTLPETVPVTLLATGTQIEWQQSQRVNISEIKKYGWEITGSVNLARINLRGAYTWNESRVGRIVDPASGMVPQGAESFYPGYSLMGGAPTHFGSFGIRYAHGKTNAQLNSTFMGSSSGLSGFDRAGIEGRETLLDDRYARLTTYTMTRSLLASQVEWVKAGYLKSDLAISHRLRSWMTGSVNVRNLSDSYKSETSYLNPTLGRQTQLGLSLRFPR